MTAHEVPTDDQVRHELNDGCPCGPDRGVKQRGDGTTGLVVAHHRLDGREETDQDTEE